MSNKRKNKNVQTTINNRTPKMVYAAVYQKHNEFTHDTQVLSLRTARSCYEFVLKARFLKIYLNMKNRESPALSS